MTKKLLTLVIAMLAALTLFSAAASAAEHPITVYLDGVELEFDVEPVTVDGRTLVPMRAIFEALGATVHWNSETRTATAEKDGIVIEIAVDKTEMKKNGQIITLDVPAQLVGQRTMVPVRAVSEGMDAVVDWHGRIRRIDIFSNVGSGSLPMFTLSDADMEILRSRYDEMRAYFENDICPNRMFGSMGEVISGIKSYDTGLTTSLYTLWDQLVAAYIRDVQSKSAENYKIIEGLSGRDELLGYMSVILDSGLEATDIFQVSLAYRPGTSGICLMEFKDTIVPGSAKYIGLAVVDVQVMVEGQMLDASKFYYLTAQSDPEDPEHLYFCAAMPPNNIGVFGTIGLEKNDFLSAIDTYFNKLRENGSI